MKIEKILSNQDSELFNEDIDYLIDEIKDEVSLFYKHYNCVLTEINFNSSLDFSSRTVITFNCDVGSKGIDPGLRIKISNLGSAYKSPSERDFETIMSFKGISDDIVNFLFKEFGLTQIFMDRQEETKNPKAKIENNLKSLKKKADEYLDHIKTTELFMF